jgi:hypothetical protein
MKDNFDVHEWNKKRYLDELEIDQEDDNVNQDNEDGSLNITHGGDDPKIGAELEAGVIGDKLAEAPGRRQATMKLNQLTFNVVKSMFGKIPMFGLSFPNADDSYRSVFDADDLENWKAGIRERYGDVNIRIDVEAASTWDRIQILDDKFRGDKEGYIKGKAATLDQWRKSSNYGFDENLNEASYMYKGYEDKHFDICPVAETLRDELLAGKFKENKWATGTNFEAELGEWRYQNDVLFKTEKQVLQDKEGDERDIEKAKVAIDRIVNLSRDLGIPAAEISYLKAHLKKITDIVEYSSLTESIKETLRFIKEHNPDFTNEEIKSELEEIKELGSQLNEKLCKKGEAYRKRRMAAGEKSSAYLSGRAVKVCKGQMSGKKKKK